MAAQTPAYRLLPLRLSAAQTCMDGLASVLWCSIFPGQRYGPNRNLDRIFARMLIQPELAALQLCPYYFDQVTYSLPITCSQSSSNLTLHCFDSWAGFQKERQETSKRRHQAGSHQNARPDAGINLSRLCQVQDLHTGGSITARVFLYLMYGYSG